MPSGTAFGSFTSFWKEYPAVENGRFLRRMFELDFVDICTSTPVKDTCGLESASNLRGVISGFGKVGFAEVISCLHSLEGKSIPTQSSAATDAAIAHKIVRCRFCFCCCESALFSFSQAAALSNANGFSVALNRWPSISSSTCFMAVGLFVDARLQKGAGFAELRFRSAFGDA